MNFIINGTCIKCNSNKIKNIFPSCNGYLCKNHFNLRYINYVLNIQKIFRGNKSRRILNNIYYKLNDDLQYKIKYFINKELYNIKYSNFIKNKIDKFINPVIEFNYNIENIEKKMSCQYFLNMFKMVLVNHAFIDLNKLKFLYVLSDELIFFFNYLITINIYLNMENVPIDYYESYLINQYSKFFDMATLNNSDNDKFYKILYSLVEFKCMYEKTYKINKKYARLSISLSV